MTLLDWLQNAWLLPHEVSPSEVRELLPVVDRDLQSAVVPHLSDDWRLAIAYNAALQAAAAALAVAGYRVPTGQHHVRLIRSLQHTIGADPAIVRQLDRFRRKRNVSEYQRAGTVSHEEVRQMLDLAVRIRAAVVAWIEAQHPEML